MPIARINNIDCYYEIHGNGSPLVLIAGLASDSQSWQPVLGRLTKHFKVIIFDNRGIGRTRYPQESFQISTLAQDTVCLLEHLAIEKADILGHSMGGYIAQEIAIEYPQKVNRLILVSTRAASSLRTKSIFTEMLKILESGKNYDLFIRKFFCQLTHYLIPAGAGFCREFLFRLITFPVFIIQFFEFGNGFLIAAFLNPPEKFDGIVFTVAFHNAVQVMIDSKQENTTHPGEQAKYSNGNKQSASLVTRI